jgi:polyribonucleotide nucleotidyltransferase
MELRQLPQPVFDAVSAAARTELNRILSVSQKSEREEQLGALRQQLLQQFGSADGKEGYSEIDLGEAYSRLQAQIMRQMIFESKKRSDGRGLTDIRPIDIEMALLPRAHGSCLFTRGETQTMAVCTLGGENMAQRYEDLKGEGSQRFYMQYFFPPFSVGETGKIGPPGRREVGHGKLAERALAATFPDRAHFPYTVRLESNITESNGSSSMASVCGGCLAMMDAGVPIERPVAGIAMGLLLEKDRYVILSDILGIEDALGDMDFKVTGDQEGITAFQMDIKVEGITPQIMRDALYQAKLGRLHILNIMLQCCPQPRKAMSRYAPRIETIQVKQSKIATIIGPGGKQIRAIIEQTGVEIDINDSGLVSIAANNVEALEKAKAIINGLVSEVEIGKVYSGRCTAIAPFGFFAEILPGKEGLCHISEIAPTRVQNVVDFVKEGDIVSVKVIDINERGQIKLSRKAAMELEPA